jgi:hypothetical protein
MSVPASPHIVRVSADAAERALWERDGLPPAWASFERSYLMACVTYQNGLTGLVRKRTRLNDPRRVSKRVARRRRMALPTPTPKTQRQVRCIETGRVFANAAEAARSAGVNKDSMQNAIRINARSGGMRWHYADTPEPAPKAARARICWREKPVVSNKGEWFPSARAAAEAFGKSAKAVSTSINENGTCANRRWTYTAAKGEAA